MLFRKFVCGFRNNMTRFPNHTICFRNSQYVVSRQHVGLYVESKLHGYVDSRFACFYLIGQLESILRKFQLAGVVLVVLKPHVFNSTRQLVWKLPKFPTLAATELFPQHCQIPNMSPHQHLRALTDELQDTTAVAVSTSKRRCLLKLMQSNLQAILIPPTSTATPRTEQRVTKEQQKGD